MVHGPWVGRHDFTLHYNTFGRTSLWLTYTLCFVPTIHGVLQNAWPKLGLWSLKPAVGGFHAQKAPNTIILTHPESLCWCDNFGTEPLQLILRCTKVHGALLCCFLDLFHALFCCFWIIRIWLVSFLWYWLLVLVFIFPCPCLAPQAAKTMI